jgi:AraC family transcriptional activator of mar-sox-rob regulon
VKRPVSVRDLNATIKLAITAKTRHLLMQQTKILFHPLRGGNQMNTGAFMHDLLDWIDNNLDSRLDIETVARRSGYSKWHLQRLFKEHTGYPLAGYIRAQKLQKSVERLSHSDEPILNVAIALGFDSQQSFNRSFKRQYGQAPGAWRRSVGGPETQQLRQ